MDLVSLALLGLPFLQPCYIMVDPDANSFALWANNAPSSLQDLRIVGGAECSSSSSLPVPATKKSVSSLNIVIGAIVGAVLGSAHGFLAILASLFLIYGRRRRLQPLKIFVNCFLSSEEIKDYEHELHGESAAQELAAAQGEPCIGWH